MTDYLDEIQARVDAATDGPWRALCDGGWDVRPDILWVRASARIGSTDFTDVATVSTPDDPHPGDPYADVEFIAHARTDVPRLVAFAKAVLALSHDPACHDDVECDCNVGNIRWLADQHLGGDR